MLFRLGIFLVHTIEMDTSYVHVYLSQRLPVNTIGVTIDLFVSLDHNVTNDESTLVHVWVCGVYVLRERERERESAEIKPHNAKDTSPWTHCGLLLGARGHKEFVVGA